MGGEWLAPRPGRFIPREWSGTHCTGDRVGSQGRSARVRKIPLPSVPDPRTVHPASRWAIPAH